MKTIDLLLQILLICSMLIFPIGFVLLHLSKGKLKKMFKSFMRINQDLANGFGRASRI